MKSSLSYVYLFKAKLEPPGALLVLWSLHRVKKSRVVMGEVCVSNPLLGSFIRQLGTTRTASWSSMSTGMRLQRWLP